MPGARRRPRLLGTIPFVRGMAREAGQLHGIYSSFHATRLQVAEMSTNFRSPAKDECRTCQESQHLADKQLDVKQEFLCLRQRGSFSGCLTTSFCNRTTALELLSVRSHYSPLRKSRIKCKRAVCKDVSSTSSAKLWNSIFKQDWSPASQRPPRATASTLRACRVSACYSSEQH